MTDQIGSPMQPADDAMPVCRYFNAVGGCRAGAGCRFRHMLPMHGSTGAVAGHRGYGGGSGSGRGGVSSSHQQSSGAFAAGGGTHFVPQLGACMFYSTPNGCRAGDSCRYVPFSPSVAATFGAIACRCACQYNTRCVSQKKKKSCNFQPCCSTLFARLSPWHARMEEEIVALGRPAHLLCLYADNVLPPLCTFMR